jgi:uncharacterized protein with GYD domain
MATFIATIKFTDRGIEAIRATTKRAAALPAALRWHTICSSAGSLWVVVGRVDRRCTFQRFTS